MFGRNGLRRSLPMFPAIFTAGLAGAAEPAAYEMVAYVDGPGSAEIFAGRYAEAVAAASSARPRTVEDALRAATNLCVALTLEREFAAAEAACSDALGLARRVDAAARSLTRRGEESGKALNNVGVLKALSGDAKSAAGDLRLAARSRWNGAARNLARLAASDARETVARTSN